MRRILLLLLLIPASFADDSSLSTFFNGTLDTLHQQGNDFVTATAAGGAGLGGAARTVYEAFGPSSCGDDWIRMGPGGSAQVVGLWLVPSVFVVLIVSFGVASIYMLGTFLQSPGLITLAKDEGWQAVISIVRVLFLVGLLLGGEAWYTINSAGSTDIVYANSDTMIDASMGFARLMVSEMVNHYSVLLIYNMVIHTIYSSTMWFGVTWRAMYSFNLGPVLKPIIDIIGTALQYLSLGLSTWLLHIITLCLIKKWTWGLFIPLSLLLRAFPYTRNAGEALFALALAMAIFYPFMFLFDYEVHKIMVYNIVDAENALSNLIHQSGILSVAGAFLVVVFLSAGVFMPFFLGTALNIGFELIRGAVYYIVIMSLLLPFLNIFVTLTIAKETANFFRVDVNFLSFLKII